MKSYKLSIWISKQSRVFIHIEKIFQNIGYNLNFWRKWECIIWNVRFVQIKGVEQIITSIEYRDIDAFIIWSDVAGEVWENVDIIECLNLKKSQSQFCLLLDKNKKIDEDKKLSQQFNFVVTKYPYLAKKYLWEDIVIKKSESDSELLAKRFWVISFEIVQSWETARQNKLDILWKTRDISSISYVWKILKSLPQNSIKIFSLDNLVEETQEELDNFVINIKSVLDAEKYDLISFNIKKSQVEKVLELFPWRQPNILETNNVDYVTLRTLILKYGIESITKIRELWGRDILVEPLRQVY